MWKREGGSPAAAEAARTTKTCRKSFLKTFQNPLDKIKRLCYNEYNKKRKGVATMYTIKMICYDAQALDVKLYVVMLCITM